MAKRKKIIQIPPENVQKIQKALKCSRVTVYNALAFRSDSELSDTIRTLALNTYGGINTFRTIMK